MDSVRVMICQAVSVSGRAASVNGIDINYELDGDGPSTIVLVSGFTDDLNSWGFQMDDLLGAGHRVLRHRPDDRPQGQPPAARRRAMRPLMEVSSFTPPVLMAASRFFAAKLMFMNLTVTNVPGPPHELYLLGAKMLELNPMLPIGTGLTLNVAVESYAGNLSIGMCCDPDAVPDLDVFTSGLAAALNELRKRAAAAPVPPVGAPIAR